GGPGWCIPNIYRKSGYITPTSGLLGDADLVARLLSAAAQQERQADGTCEVPDPVRAGHAAARPAVIGPRLQAEGHAVADEEDPLAEPAVYRVRSEEHTSELQSR